MTGRKENPANRIFAIDHQTSVKTQAAERYLLDELSPAEREAFEEHFFTCQTCADDVRALFRFADNAREVLRDEQPAPLPVQRGFGERVSRWVSAFLPRPAAFVTAAAALLAAVTLYQTAVIIPGLRSELDQANSAQAVTPAVLRPLARGSDSTVTAGAADRFIHLMLDVNFSEPYPAYRCDLRNETGELLYSVVAESPALGASLSLLFPASDLQPGWYTLTVRGETERVGNAPEIENYRFLVERN